MCREVLEIVRQSDTKNIEMQLALQCAPVIADLKCANLLNLSRNRIAEVQAVLDGSGLSAVVLCETKERTASLVFREEELGEVLSDERARRLLRRFGYRRFSTRDAIWVFAARYRRYLSGEGAFPHEIGVLLGYPLEDVEGFIRYRGQHYLYAGYWKVYRDAPEKIRMFRKIEEEKDKMVRILAKGIPMERILTAYEARRTMRRAAV